MAKYVCDFDTIRTECEALENQLSELSTNLTNNKTKLDSDLISWTGQASSSYKSSSDAITSQLTKDIETMRQMSNYIKDSINKIEEADNNLASLKF